MPIRTNRLLLEPLRPGDAAEMFDVLNDVRLHVITAGVPDTLEELRARFGRLASQRSPDGLEAWLNWIVRLDAHSTAIGYVQATVTGAEAELAWIIGVPWQGQGYAGEAALAMSEWLESRGVTAFQANIRPGHTASEAVALRAGFLATSQVVDGEVIWRRPAGGDTTPKSWTTIVPSQGRTTEPSRDQPQGESVPAN